jgi:hypothetical protein
VTFGIGFRHTGRFGGRTLHELAVRAAAARGIREASERNDHGDESKRRKKTRHHEPPKNVRFD